MIPPSPYIPPAANQPSASASSFRSDGLHPTESLPRLVLPSLALVKATLATRLAIWIVSRVEFLLTLMPLASVALIHLSGKSGEDIRLSPVFKSKRTLRRSRFPSSQVVQSGSSGSLAEPSLHPFQPCSRLSCV